MQYLKYVFPRERCCSNSYNEFHLDILGGMNEWMDELFTRKVMHQYIIITDRANFHKYIHLHIIYNSSEIL